MMFLLLHTIGRNVSDLSETDILNNTFKVNIVHLSQNRDIGSVQMQIF